MAITLVIFVHCLVNSFDASGLNPDDVPTIQQKKDGIIKSLVQIGIPMFFYISGMGATFLDTEKNNYGIFVGGKILRLLVPFVVAIFVFLIPRLYFGQQYEDFTRNNDVIESDYMTYMKAALPTIYLKLSWLWYLPALFIDCMLTYPLLRWTIRRSRQIPYDPVIDSGIVLLQIVTLFVWALPNYYLVTAHDYNTTLLIPAICVLGAVMFCFYTFQLLIPGRNGHHYAIWIKFVGPIGSVLLNMYKVQTQNMNLYHIFLMINYDAIFFSQGVIDMCYWRPMLKKRKDMADSVLAPCAILFFIFMYSLTSPTNYGNMGHLFFYPLYSTYGLQCLYTSGTWLWVYTIIWIMAEIANDKFHEGFYNYMCGSSLYAYVSHYFFILLISVMIVRPNHMEFIPALFLMFFGCQLMIAVTYIPLNFLYELIIPPKPTKAMELKPEGAEAEKKEAAEKANAKAEAIEGKGQPAIDLEAENVDKDSNASVSKKFDEEKFE